MLMDVPPMKQESDWVVSPQERKHYLDIFKASDDDGDGFVTGGQARNIFSSSGLPLPLLGQIWYVLTFASTTHSNTHPRSHSPHAITLTRVHLPRAHTRPMNYNISLNHNQVNG